jgi:hypothetical protein
LSFGRVDGLVCTIGCGLLEPEIQLTFPTQLHGESFASHLEFLVMQRRSELLRSANAWQRGFADLI